MILLILVISPRASIRIPNQYFIFPSYNHLCMLKIDKLDQQDTRNKINISLFYVGYHIN